MCSTPIGTTCTSYDLAYKYGEGLWNLVSTEPVAKAPEGTKKKGKPMYDCDCEDSIEIQRLDYSKNRASSIVWNKRSDLRKQFKMDAPSAPKTIEELVERINNKAYTIKPKDDGQHYWSVLDRMSWRIPGEVADEAGYEIANNALNAQHVKTLDEVTLGNDIAALAALQAFDAWTYTAS